MMMGWISLGGLLLLLGTTSAQACAARFFFNFGQASNGVMTAESGTACTAPIDRTSAQTVVRKISVTIPPKNGTASAGAHGVTYRSKPGFQGNDAFTFTIFGDGSSGKGLTATVQMDVAVK